MKLSALINELKSFKEAGTDPEVGFCYPDNGKAVSTTDNVFIVDFPEIIKIYLGFKTNEG